MPQATATTKAASVEDFGLVAASKDNLAAGTTVVPVWGLTASSELEMPEDIISLPYSVAGTSESVIGGVDSRTLVAPEDLGPGGKYRGKC